jgi:hypothetical protein
MNATNAQESDPDLSEEGKTEKYWHYGYSSRNVS